MAAAGRPVSGRGQDGSAFAQALGPAYWPPHKFSDESDGAAHAATNATAKHAAHGQADAKSRRRHAGQVDAITDGPTEQKTIKPAHKAAFRAAHDAAQSSPDTAAHIAAFGATVKAAHISTHRQTDTKGRRRQGIEIHTATHRPALLASFTSANVRAVNSNWAADWPTFPPTFVPAHGQAHAQGRWWRPVALYAQTDWPTLAQAKFAAVVSAVPTAYGAALEASLESSVAAARGEALWPAKQDTHWSTEHEPKSTADEASKYAAQHAAHTDSELPALGAAFAQPYLTADAATDAATNTSAFPTAFCPTLETTCVSPLVAAQYPTQCAADEPNWAAHRQANAQGRRRQISTIHASSHWTANPAPVGPALEAALS